MTCVAKYDFSIPQGTDLSVPFILKDSEGTPVRLEGFSVRMQLRRFVTAPDVIDELSTENGRVTLDDNGGGARFYFRTLSQKDSQVVISSMTSSS